MKTNKSVIKMTEFLRLTNGISSMIGVVFAVIFITHLVSCFWFLMAKLYDFPPECWVTRQQDGWQDSFGSNPDFNAADYEPGNNVTLWYTMSFYWAL